jgi:putative phage-type endonuclease
MKIHNVAPNSAEWMQLRAGFRTASEAPAMMGASKYQTRTALLHQKKTGVSPDVDGYTQGLFDRGHQTEAEARSIVEVMIDDDLYPVTCTDDPGYLLASLDGRTYDGKILFEHKLWSEDLAAQVRAKELTPHYYWQLEQQLLVTGAEKVIFVCSDGTEDNFVQMDYRAVPGRAEQLMAGWKQFDADLAAYIPTEAAAPVVAAPQLGLPAVSIMVNGSIALVDNLDKFGVALNAYIAKLNRKPETDQDFANLEDAVKRLKVAEEQLDAAESGALGQVESVDTMRKTVALHRETARTTRLLVEKLVKAEKETRRTAIISEAAAELHTHVRKCNDRIGRAYMPAIAGDFQGVVKGLKSLDSMKDKVATELARCKIAANEWADKIQLNLGTDGLEEYSGLFADIATLCLKAPEDFKNTVTARITAHQAKEAARLESEREKIRAEEQAKAQREAAAEASRAEAVRVAAEQMAKATTLAVTDAMETGTGVTKITAFVEEGLQVVTQHIPVANVIPMTRPASTPPTLKLGAINERLGFGVTADFLQSLGFTATSDRNAKLYQEADFTLICAALVNHIQAVQAKQAA